MCFPEPNGTIPLELAIRMRMPPLPPVSQKIPLIAHVGRHKTGSTSVQHILQGAQEALIPEGILYPNTGLVGSQHLAFPAALLGRHPCWQNAGKVDIHDLIEGLRQEAKQRRSHACLISSEVFCELAYRLPESGQILLDMLGSWFDLSLVQVVRDPHEYGVSAVKHQLRQNALGDWSPLGWYLRCQRKHQSLDDYWSTRNIPIETVDYDATDVVAPLLNVLNRSIGSSVLADLAAQERNPDQGRLNSDLFENSVYLLYCIYWFREKTERHPGTAPRRLMPFQDFANLLLSSGSSPQLDAAREKQLSNDMNHLFQGYDLDSHCSDPNLPANPSSERDYLESTAAFAMMGTIYTELEFLWST